MKVCSRCKETKSLDEFYKRDSYKDGIVSRCKKCHSETLTRTKPTKRQIKNWNLKRVHKLSIETYEEMCAKQDHKCLICKETPEILYVDHCHKSGKIRGLLCSACNVGLGCFRDKTESLDAAKKYLEIGW